MPHGLLNDTDLLVNGGHPLFDALLCITRVHSVDYLQRLLQRVKQQLYVHRLRLVKRTRFAHVRVVRPEYTQLLACLRVWNPQLPKNRLLTKGVFAYVLLLLNLCFGVRLASAQCVLRLCSLLVWRVL